MTHKYYQLLAGTIAAVIFTMLPFQIAYADDPDHCGSGAEGVGEAAIEAYVPGPPDLYILEQPFGGRSGVATAGEYIQLVYSYAAGIIGIIAVVLIMAGGFMWIAAGGNEQTISTAKDIIISAVTAVFIMVLSFAILYVVNPKFTTQTFTVPKIPIKGCVVPDGTVISIPSHANLNGSGSLCPGAVTALIQVADALGAVCPTCKIGIGSTYRSSESQEPLYAGYVAAVEAGYFAADGKTKTTPGCPPESNGSCNLAAKPCCSNHRMGTAIDAWFEDEGADATVFAKTSKGKLSQDFNNGGGDAALKANQLYLKQWMEGAVGGKQLFKGIAAEWWHFDFQGNCGTTLETACSTGLTAADGTKTSAAGYCYATSGGDAYYHYAVCNPGNPATCGTWSDLTWTYISPGTCTSEGEVTHWYTFDDDDLASSDASLGIYTKGPFCNTSDSRGF